jgi:hypothetical protein
MELILTDDEKKANTWLELDDATLGKVTKAVALKLKNYNIKNDPMAFMAAALLLCNLAAEANADDLKQTIEGLTIQGKDFGNWLVTVKRLKAMTK